MKLLIVIVIAFLILIYAFTYINYKKNKSHSVDTVSDFRKKYMKGTSQKEKITRSDDRTNFITKYNSSIDYVEKDKFKDG